MKTHFKVTCNVKKIIMTTALQHHEPLCKERIRRKSIYPNNTCDVYLYIYLLGVRLHGIDRRKLEKNTGLPVLWILL